MNSRNRQKRSSARAPARRRDPLRRGPGTGWLIGAGVAVVVGIALVIAVVSTSSSGGGGSYGRSPAPAPVVDQVTSAPSQVVEAVGAGSAELPQATHQSQSLGEPDVLFIGAEYCPYCAAERWAIVNALARFGTFSNLAVTHSSATDVHPNTATFSFYGSSYTSPLLTFTPVEIATNEPSGTSYKSLETPSADQQQKWLQYSPTGGVPFLDIAGRYVITAPTYDVSVLAGKTHEQIAAALSDPNDPITRGVVGAANGITAAICQVTGNQPKQACDAPAIQQLGGRLGS